MAPRGSHRASGKSMAKVQAMGRPKSVLNGQGRGQWPQLVALSGPQRAEHEAWVQLGVPKHPSALAC